MKYRKFKGEALFTGYEYLTGGEVLVTDENGGVVEILAGGDIGDAERFEGTICPGFINTHCHLELSWMKGLIPENTGMIDFLLAVMQTKRPEEQEIKSAIYKAEAQMIRSGIVAVGDICNTSVTIDAKKDRLLYYQNFIETMGFIEASAKERFSQAVKVFNEFAEIYPLPVACNSIVPHSPYSVSKYLFEEIIRFPGNQLITIHNQEHPAENEFFLEGTGDFHRLYKAIGIDSSFHMAQGKSSVQYYLPWLLRNQTLILVHNTETNLADLKFINEQRARGVSTWLCLCPNANLYINQKLPDISTITENTDKITIGTDSLASNTRLDILEEIKTIHKNYPSIPLQDLLRWSTINGARALDIDDVAGSFEKGKQPGVVLIQGISDSSITKDAKSTRLL
jgi:cytosine/adenosine deaminase-related metal-dependent hydrolase